MPKDITTSLEVMNFTNDHNKAATTFEKYGSHSL